MDRSGVALALSVLLLGGTAVPASAQVQAKRQELSQIQKELEKTKAELEEFRRQASGLSRDLHKLENRDGETRRRIAGIQKNIVQAENRRVEIKSRMSAITVASDFWGSVFASELREYAAELAVREPAWSGRGLWAEAFRRAVLLEKTRMVASLRGYRVKTEAAHEAARRKSQELRDKSRQAQAEERSVRAEFERTQVAVAEARERVAVSERRAKELEETKLALTQLLSRIVEKVRYERKGPATGLDIPKHSLPWPVAGRVARPFGKERNSELNTWVIHQGVTFATGAGAAVAAVDSGQIIYAGPFRSYGKVVIVDHGGGFFSIYGELGDIIKAKGSEVAAGEALGKAGGSAEKGTLYLELRRGTAALDPMAWLQAK
ncbi:MAG: peptidoglycan DD-metalloendopeptidase family protein [Elusimicrobiota bacterium]|jgi:septal ring factor EnvC (AmiA/AmiB activator)